MARTTDVVVVGGGYAGVVAANRLTTNPDVRVTLVNPRGVFVERLRLHQRTVGTHEAVVDFSEVLAPTVGLTVDEVTRIDAANRTIEPAAGGTVVYDYMVYAVGSHDAPAMVPGVSEHAYPLATLEQAKALHDSLDNAGPAAPVTVIGGGATGIEVASELAEHSDFVTLVTGGQLGPYLHPSARCEVARQLDRLGVTVLDGAGALVTAVEKGAVHLADGRDLPSAITVWTAGFGVPDLARRSGLSTDALGRLLTDETLTSVDTDRIVAAGDASAPSGVPYRMCCAAALPLGAHAADTVLRRVAGREPRPVSVSVPGQCLSLGRRAGVLQLARRDDTAVALHAGGRLGAWFKETVTAGNRSSLGLVARRPRLIGALTAVQDPRRERLLQALSAAPVAIRGGSQAD